MITSLLVANRGEIARRVFRTARDLGITTVAVHSDADAGAPHVREADAAVRLPGNTPAETYLRADLLVRAALEAGADAVHPGYGFLSENAGFARAVLDAGLTWVGPPVEAIERMGSKIESKRLMAAAGVPVLTAAEDTAELTDADLPLLVKASAGGGGRGMRVVRRVEDLPAELAAARSEAASAFGDPTVFVEPYLETGHHIEVQVMADRHGVVWAVGERECSIQRRHQKVVEEAPSPLVERTAGMRERLFDAARKAAGAIGYEGAGTVEFLADDSGRFYFLEMNTRLQVEHPVTECVTGLDLVALQLSVAEGTPLPAEPPAATGHAIEVRLYAEDPALDWRPQSGTLHRFEVPGVTAEFAVTGERGLRLDSGVEPGSVVGVHYDPMLAKVIAWAPERTAAARALAGALAKARVHGVRTNRDLLVRVLRHPAFLAGDTDTAFFDKHGLDALAAPLADEDAEALSALAAALADAEANRAAARVLGRIPAGWRNVVSQPQVKSYTGAAEHEVRYRVDRGGLVADGVEGVRLVSAAPDAVELEVAGVRRRFEVATAGTGAWVDSALGPVALTAVDRFPDPADQVAAGSLLAPMPGTVVRVAVAAGEAVAAGQPLLWLEAMKMEHRIDAPTDGVVAELPVAAGDQVDVGRVLAVVTSSADQEGS
ncbi:acetyl/propionyl/methylcrotonyl-CoA carboxylase subunit alpha [Actinokineospora bangkokensis]|uniref:Acetyl/propionyl-CoA carboxylase subuit alpha n=1 Tax=Actinokineospora bangkokensis TaxID=1193682 RepID=A0A1Q9LSK6_9PSEU|nr:biotin carboxylase N-terminal domain-containing protein [Actinokineospora bangkokensis]OLR95015.1 acetyl/propionyl-CoA carboxylase subuit alpha [Actinokineospora bangkokensis]